MAKDLAIILNNGSINAAVASALAAQKFPTIAGIGRRDRSTLFVSRGVGTIYVPVRVNCPPEGKLTWNSAKNGQ